MSNIAKVFVVINFVLSILYMGFAATLLSQQWDYREKYLEQEYIHQRENTETSEELKDAQAQVENLKALLTQREKVAREHMERNQQLDEENKALKREKQSFQVALSKISTEITDINAKVASKDERIAKLETQLDQQKKIAEEALKSKEDAQDEQQRLEILLSNSQGELAEKEKLLQRSQKELWESKQIIRSVRDAGVNIPALFRRARALDGQVVAVSHDSEVPIVMLSLGTDDGVEKGYKFTVYRGSYYIGQVAVEEVYKDMAAARIVKEMTARSIKRGDNVTTRIGGGGS